MNQVIHRWGRVVPLVCLLALTGCVTAPQGPRVAVGSAMSGRRDHTASGAATGLIMGTMIGAGNSASEGTGCPATLRHSL